MSNLTAGLDNCKYGKSFVREKHSSRNHGWQVLLTYVFLCIIVSTVVSNTSAEPEDVSWTGDFRYANEGVIQGLVGIAGLIGEFLL